MKQLKRMLLVMGVLLLSASVAYAHEAYQDDDDGESQPDGSIRGTVYLDNNNNGKCAGENEPIIAGIPLRFASGEYETFLQSGENGTYGLVAAAYGTWSVTAQPNTNEYVVTSEATRSVFLSVEEPLVLGVDFCVIGADKATRRPAVLPNAGGSASNLGFAAATLSGLMLIGAGAFVQVRRRSI